MTEELKVVLRRSEYSGFGFSLLGTTGPPHVIYDIIENSPAADCAVEAGDIILKVNGTDVHRYTTKEVLKCLRLSDDLVTLELRRDPKLKARIKEQLANTKSPHYVDIESQNNYDYRRGSSHHISPTSTGTHRHATALQDHNIHHETHISNSSISNLNVVAGGSSSPAAIRYVSPTNFSPSSHRQATTTNSPSSANHSRSSSGSSAKIQIPVETNSTSEIGAAAVVSTSPTCRPSRIPTALKCPQKAPVQHSPQYKRPRPSQIPTKALSISANGNAPTSCPTGSSVAPFQHSKSYSDGSGNSRFPQQQYQNQQIDQDPAPTSTPAQPAKAPRFEAYMMTGDLILNLSRTPQSSNLIPAHAKKIDSLRDSPNRAATTATARPNGALAPRASGESSPTSSSSVESPTHTASSDSVDMQKKQHKEKFEHKHHQQHQLLQQLKCDSTNNSYNNSNNGGGDDRCHYIRKDSLTNDTLLLCEELKRDEEADVAGDEDQDLDEDDDLNEEDQTHYDITNIETYNSGGNDVGDGGGDETTDHQRLVMNYDEDDGDGSGIAAGDEEEDNYSTNNSLASVSAKQRLRALKQKASVAAGSSTRYNKSLRGCGDSVDCPQGSRIRHYYTTHHGSGSSSSSATVRSDDDLVGGGINTSSPDETSFSVPTSPISLSTPLLIDKETANSVPTSPEPLGAGAICTIAGIHDSAGGGGAGVVRRHNGVVRTCDSAGFRTSKSEDHLQQIQREGIAAVIPIDIDEDVNSSLNTLLDTRHDSEDSQGSNHDRIVWTYNAPLPPHQQQHYNQYPTHYGGGGSLTSQSPNSHTHSHSHSSSISSSPQHSAGSPASPTSVSSSVMSSSGSKGALGIGGNYAMASNNQQQYQQQQQLTNTNGGTMTTNTATGTGTVTGTTETAITMVSDAAVHRQQHQQQQQQVQKSQQSEHKLVIQVRGIDSSNSVSPRSAYSELKDSEYELATLTEEQPATLLACGGGGSGNDARESSPPVSDDGSDVESLHSYHYSPKAVDMPSAIRLAKRLYSLDGFKKSDVSRHLSKNNDFSRAVADEYLKYFNFEKKTLDQSLREFLQQFSLSGETQERERVLVHFSKRFLDCNPGTFNSQDAVHTLTCAIMLLNTDLHGQNTGRKMTCAEFVENLAELNDGENFPKDVLKYLYQAIKTQPLEWALDDDAAELQKQRNDNMSGAANSHVGQNPFLDIPESSTAIEYKKGYVMRKCCYDSNYKKTPFGKRSWKMFYCTLRDLVLFLHKDEHGFRKSQMSDNLHNAIRIHHAVATKAADYTKKQHVFRLQTADQAEYLFQTSDSKELTSWVETINFVCAAYSAPPLEGGVGSQKRFQRPLLPSTHTKLLMKEQLGSHEQQLAQIENVLIEHRKSPIPSKGLSLQNYKDKENYLQYELRRYETYVSILSAKLLADQQQIDMLQLTNNEESDTFPIANIAAAVTAGVRQQHQQEQQQQQQSANRYIHQQQDLG